MLEIFTVVNGIIGLVTPLIIEKAAPMQHYGAKLAIALGFCIVGGFLATVIDNYPLVWDVDSILGNIAAVFTVSQVAWRTTWSHVLK